MRGIAIALFLAAFVATGALAADAEKKDDPKPAPSAEKKDPALTTGKAVEAVCGCSKCCFKQDGACGPAVKIGEKVYRMKASDTASAKTKELISKMEKSSEPVKVKVVGEAKEDPDHKHWYHVGELLLEM